jgi:rod shape-determining protein MreC
VLAVRPHPTVLLAAACGALYVASAAQVRTGTGTALSVAVAHLTEPVLQVGEELTAAGHDFLLGQRDIENVLGQVAELRQDNARLRRENQLLAAEVALLRQGHRLLAALPGVGDDAILARVMARDVLVGHSLRLDRGSAHGVFLDAAVLGEAGVLGRVDRVAATSCRVQLLAHPSAAAAARIVGVEGEALLTGGDKPALTGLPPYTTVEAGLPVVTTGSEGIYPPGLLLGTTGEARTEGFFTVVPVVLAAKPAEVAVALVLPSRTRKEP